MKRDFDPNVIKYYELPFPGLSKQKRAKPAAPTLERTALYVPTDVLMNQIDFRAGAYVKDVQITHQSHSLLKLVFREGKIGPRFGEGGLEDDITRQQMIVYVFVVWSGHMLFYRRPVDKEVKQKDVKFLGDDRLKGRVSVGFGGHKTMKDVEDAGHRLAFLGNLFSGVMPEMANVVGLNNGILHEVEEEIGVRPEDISRLVLLGGFRDMRRQKNETAKVPVNHVHTAIAGVVELRDDAAEHLMRIRLPAHEVAEAWWVKLSGVAVELKKHTDTIESWSEVMVKEFLPRYIEAIEESVVSQSLVLFHYH